MMPGYVFYKITDTGVKYYLHLSVCDDLLSSKGKKVYDGLFAFVKQAALEAEGTGIYPNMTYIPVLREKISRDPDILKYLTSHKYIERIYT